MLCVRTWRRVSRVSARTASVTRCHRGQDVFASAVSNGKSCRHCQHFLSVHPCQNKDSNDCAAEAECIITGTNTYTCKCKGGYIDASPRGKCHIDAFIVHSKSVPVIDIYGRISSKFRSPCIFLFRLLKSHFAQSITKHIFLPISCLSFAGKSGRVCNATVDECKTRRHDCSKVSSVFLHDYTSRYCRMLSVSISQSATRVYASRSSATSISASRVATVNSVS